MDAKEFLDKYMQENGKDEKWLEEKIAQKKASVGGLLSEQGAIYLIAGERGWQPCESDGASDLKIDGRYLTDIGDENLSHYISDTKPNGTETGRIDSLIVKVVSISDARDVNSKYTIQTTGVKVTDGDHQAWINFHDKPAFVSSKGNNIPGNSLSTEIQMIRSGLLGRIIEVQNIDVWKTPAQSPKLGTNNFTKLKVLKDLTEGDKTPSNNPIILTGVGNTSHPNSDKVAVQRALDAVDNSVVVNMSSCTNDNHTMIYNFIFTGKGVSVGEIAQTFTDLDRLDIELIVKDLIESGEVLITNDGLIKVL